MKINLLLILIMLLTFTSQHIACNKKSKAPQNANNNDSDAATKATAAQVTRDAAAQAAKDKIATRAANKALVRKKVRVYSTIVKPDKNVSVSKLNISPDLYWVRTNTNTKQWVISIKRNDSDNLQWLVLVDDPDFNITSVMGDLKDDPEHGIHVIYPYNPLKFGENYNVYITGVCKQPDSDINFEPSDFDKFKFVKGKKIKHNDLAYMLEAKDKKTKSHKTELHPIRNITVY